MVRGDLRALDLNLRKGRPRKGGIDELRAQLTAHQPEFYDALDTETFEQLVLLADTWDVTEQIIARRPPNGPRTTPTGSGRSTRCASP